MKQDHRAQGEGDYSMTNQNLLNISWVQSRGQGWGQVCGGGDGAATHTAENKNLAPIWSLALI